MTELFKTILEGQNYPQICSSLTNVIEEIFGPMTVRERWKALEFVRPTRRHLNLEGPANDVSSQLLAQLLSEPDSVQTDLILRFLQQRTEEDIYPGSRQDLGIEEK